jgi:prepilin-type N-terminal cleavage/methylation domain-containing protein
MQSRFGYSGFSIVELLTVVAVIGVLATLAISNFSMFKGQALNATAASDARGLVPGVDTLSTQNGGPPASIPPFGPNGGDVLCPLCTNGRVPGGKSSPGTLGTIDFGPGVYDYRIQTHQPGGDCYTVTNGVMTVSSICS